MFSEAAAGRLFYGERQEELSSKVMKPTAFPAVFNGVGFSMQPGNIKLEDD